MPPVLVPPPPSIVNQSMLKLWAWARKQKVESNKQKPATFSRRVSGLRLRSSLVIRTSSFGFCVELFISHLWSLDSTAAQVVRAAPSTPRSPLPVFQSGFLLSAFRFLIFHSTPE